MGRDATEGGEPRTNAATADAGATSSESGGPEAAPDERIGARFFEEEMGPGSAMAHLYRGEVQRMTLWRERLDRTTNWAVIVIAALLTWVFSSEANPHYVLLVGIAVLGVFLGDEAHRYRGYDVWRSRVRIMQVNAFAYALDPRRGIEDPDWREKLSSDYRDPAMKITREEAVAHRLRRIYLPLAVVVLAAWVVRITVFADVPWPESAAVGSIPGTAVTAVVAVVYLAAAIVALRPRKWRTRGELLEQDLRGKTERGR